MRKVLIAVCALLFFMTFSSSNAQTKGITVSYWTYGALPLEKDGPMRTSFNASIGYNFNEHFALQGLITPDFVFFTKNDINTFEGNILLGLAGSYMLYDRDMTGHEIFVGAANTIGAKKYKYNYFDIGYRMNVGIGKTKIKLTYGLGIKYYNSQSSSFDNSTAIYVNVGVKFN